MKMLGAWEGEGASAVVRDFELTEQQQRELEGADLLLAWYGRECYEGSAYVLFMRGGKLYEVHGNHCSCYGLEQQWEPEETCVAMLVAIIDSYWCKEFRDELRQVIESLGPGRAS